MVERRVSEVEDGQVATINTQKQMEKTLYTLQAKAKDLETRSWCNNLQIVGLAVSTNILNMEQFIEQLLRDLFSHLCG